MIVEGWGQTLHFALLNRIGGMQMDEQTVRLSLLIGVLVVLAIISVFVKRKGKFILFGIFLLVTTLFTYNELTMDQRISEQYEEYAKMIESHLNETYPDENWELTYDHTELTEAWSYEFYVVFDNEPIVTYSYTVEDGEVIQAAARTDEQYDDYQHNE